MEEPQGPRVTALIVSRNGAAELRLCLEQLEKSVDRERLEILVVDDGSTDGTQDVPGEFPSAIHLRLPKRFGWTRAVNIGLRTAKGDGVLLLPQNAAVAPHTVSRLAERLEASSETGAVCSAIPRAWPFPSPAALATAWRTGELPGAQAVPDSGETTVDYPRGAPMMLRRGFLRGMNFLDDRFGDQWSDLELCSRVRGGGKSIVVLGDVPARLVTEGPKQSSLIEWIDSAHGIATWIGVHHGFGASLQFRVGAALHALKRGRTSAFTGILMGTKIDGNQT